MRKSITSPSIVVTILKDRGLSHLFKKQNLRDLEGYVKKYFPDARVDSVRRVGVDHLYVETNEEERVSNALPGMKEWYTNQVNK